MELQDVTLAERGQIVIPKEARDALGLRPGSRLQLRVEDGRLVVQKRVQLNLERWLGAALDKGLDDGLTADQALAELRGRPVPWSASPDGGAVATAPVPASRKRAKPAKPDTLAKASKPSERPSNKAVAA